MLKPESEINPDLSLDLRGESCPFPLMHTLEAIGKSKSGDVIRVLTDCPSSFRNIPAEMNKRNYKMPKAPEKQGAEYVFYISV